MNDDRPVPRPAIDSRARWLLMGIGPPLVVAGFYLVAALV